MQGHYQPEEWCISLPRCAALFEDFRASGGQSRVQKLHAARCNAEKVAHVTAPSETQLPGIGRVKKNVAPWPSCDSAQIVPPCLSRIRRAMGKPMPAPG